jgi:hypothetical protein
MKFGILREWLSIVETLPGLSWELCDIRRYVMNGMLSVSRESITLLG